MAPNEPMENWGNWPFEDGMPVYGAGGDRERLGAVRNYDPQAGYLDIQKGWLFHKDFYVLLSDVAEVTGNGLTLRLSKGDLDDDRFSTPPVIDRTVQADNTEMDLSEDDEPIDMEDEDDELVEVESEEVTMVTPGESGSVK